MDSGHNSWQRDVAIGTETIKCLRVDVVTKMYFNILTEQISTMLVTIFYLANYDTGHQNVHNEWKHVF